MLGGLHGEPFVSENGSSTLRPPGFKGQYWPGYCNHGNILLPTWHRVCCCKVEQQLQRIVPGVTLPFWDESSKASQKLGIPWVLTAEKFELEDGTIISNPLRSFTLPEGISDDLPGDGYTYSKPTGYSTVRYALSGLVGSEDIEATRKHNSQYQDHDQNVKLLNRNVCAWLRGSGPTPEHQHPTENGAASGLEKCLAAPNYTVFSNASSVAAWNANSNTEKFTSLEQPHMQRHPPRCRWGRCSQKRRVLADRGGERRHGREQHVGVGSHLLLSPLHIDRTFWLWQKKHKETTQLAIAKDLKH